VVRRLAARMLRDSGFLVAEASSAQEALQQLASSQGIRLVLTDVVMPGMDSIKLADTIQERYPDRRVVLMMAYTGMARKIGSHAPADPSEAVFFGPADATNSGGARKQLRP
jgi:CheY-like chemotaxis protein